MPGLSDRASVEAFLNAHAPIVEPTLLAVGDAVGDWRVLAFIGRGGCGEVYRVRHARLGVVAAMKVLSRDDAASRGRLRREAKILAEHSHPAFPRFLGYGETDACAYLVIELLEEMPLPNADRDVARYLCKVCEGVASLHGLGLVHRDIKPSNVLQRGATGQPVLIDLGLVKDTTLSPVHEGVSLSVVDGRTHGVGTPRYSAPEQFAGGTISPAADVHALGMLANECFGGKPPRPWERIIRRSTSSIPSQRYATVDEFVRAVRARHRGRFAIAACLVPAALATLVAVGWTTARASALRDGEKVAARGTSERLEIAAADAAVAENPASVGVASNEAVKAVVTASEVAKRPLVITYPQSGAFSGDAAGDADF